MIRAMLNCLRARNREEPPIDRGKKRKRPRRFFFRPRCERPKRIIVSVFTQVLVVVLCISAGNLISYWAEYLSSRQVSEEMRRAYYEGKEQENLSTAAPTISQTAPPSPLPEITAPPVLVAALQPTATPAARLAAVAYPDNPYTITSSRFQKIRRQNDDIIGWLTIEDLLDEAVVQRDNQYYLTRDYRGYHNQNGAIFLEESTSLRTRPFTLMLYGHNMKSGGMFGGLRNYENLTYYRNNPFVIFDSVYEDGRYVIFAVCTISTDADNWRYMNFAHLNSSFVELRQQAIDSLFRFSEYDRQVDIQPNDQLLLLITCVGEETDRRIIAARRLRDDETEESLLRIVQRTRKK